MADYYKHEHLPAFGSISEGAPELAKKFFDYYNAVFAEGALSEREKCLIALAVGAYLLFQAFDASVNQRRETWATLRALAVAHTVQCPYCIDAYTSASLEKGSDLEQMTEAVHVAVAIRGGASLVHGVQMLEHVHKKGM